MLQDLDATLKELLIRELPPDMTLGESRISFVVPDSEFSGSVGKPAINLFLYDVRENMELRQNDWSVERDGGRATKRRNPVRVNCSYLITAWADDASDEHYFLGEVMKVLLRHRELPASVLQGEFQGQEPPLRTVALGIQQLQSLGEFWQAMGGQPRVALSYAVTISVDVNEMVDLGPLVTEKQINLSSM